MYRTNGLWYARVGNGQALIDTAKYPSIKAAGCKDSSENQITTKYNTTASDDDAVHMAIDNDVLKSTPRIHSTTAWPDAPPPPSSYQRLFQIQQ